MVAILSVVLVLISIGTILGPVGTVVIIYYDDLSQLVNPPQIKDIMEGNSNVFPDFGNSNNGNSDIGGLMEPVFVSAQSDPATHTFTGIFEVTNNLNYDLTLNSFSTDAEIPQNSTPAGNIRLSSPVTFLQVKLLN
jgi:hypothetical protein